MPAWRGGFGHELRITARFAAGDRRGAKTAVAELLRNRPQWVPLNLWAESFPASVALAVGSSLGEALEGAAYDEGLLLILNDLASEGDA